VFQNSLKTKLLSFLSKQGAKCKSPETERPKIKKEEKKREKPKETKKAKEEKEKKKSPPVRQLTVNRRTLLIG